MASPKPQRKIPGLYQRNGVWYLRVVVPDAIKDQPPYNGNRLRCNVSLKTRDPEAARVEALALRAEYEAEFLRAKDALRAPRVSEVPKALAEYIVARARHIILSTDDVLRYTPDAARTLLAAIDPPRRFFTAPGDPEVVPESQRPTEDGSMSEGTLDRLQTLQASVLNVRKGELARGQLKPVETVCERIASELGVTVDWASPSARTVLIDVLRATVSAWGDTVRRGDGEPAETPEAPIAPVVDATAPAGAQPTTLADILQDWIGAKRPKPDAISRMRLALSRWEDSGCAVPLDKIDRQAGHRFKVWLLDAERGLSDKAAKNMLDAIKALLSLAVDAGRLPAHPWTRLTVEVKDAKKRRPFTHADLRLLFSGSLYEHGDLPEHRNAAAWAAYWLPLMGLYSGARLGELGQMAPADVADMNGIQALLIHEEVEGTTIKSEAGDRQIPVHPELVRLGFLEYVQAMREAGHAHLFPTLNNTSKGPSAVFGKWFRLRLDEVGITTGLKTFHAFRHTVRSELASMHVGQETTDAILGHAATGSTGATTYTHIRLQGMAEALARLKFPIDLPRVYKKH